MFLQIILHIAVILTWSSLSCTKSPPSREKQEFYRQSRDQGTQITRKENEMTSSVERPLDDPFPQNGTSGDSDDWFCVARLVRHWDSCRNRHVTSTRCKSQHVGCILKKVPPKCEPVYGYPRGDQSKKNCPKLPINCQCAD